MNPVQQRLENIRRAAKAGDAEAARELGRLLGLIPAGTEEPEDDEWPCMWWFRRALETRPGDHEAAVLLAARLSRYADDLAYAYGLDDEDEDDEEDEEDGEFGEADEDEEDLARRDCERKRTEARRLYEEVLRVDPACPAARSGLAALRDAPFSVTPYGHYLVEGEYWSGTAGCREQLVVGDAEELRWACGEWFGHIAGLGAYHLSVYASGERLSRVSLEPLGPAADGSLDWSGVVVPPVPGEPLPHGHPALLDGHVVHYGWHSLELG